MSERTVRHARVDWEGSLEEGRGQLTLATSESLVGMPLTWEARTTPAPGQTSPEELLAAALASCFAMALAAELPDVPEGGFEIESQAELEPRDDGVRIASIGLTVSARSDRVASGALQRAAERARRRCAITNTLERGLPLRVEVRTDPLPPTEDRAIADKLVSPNDAPPA